MGKRQSFVVNGELFETKKALEERVQAIVASYKDNEQLNMFDFEFVLDLLGNHPHADVKIGGGVALMQVKRNPVYPSTRGFYLTRQDGSGTDFSWRKCLTPPPKTKKVRAAFRALIEPDTMHFKQEFFDNQFGVATCEITGEEIRYIGSHVDHRPPNTFDKIFADFLAEFDIDLEGVELKGEMRDNKYQDELADKSLADMWLAYHRHRADLRVISSAANLRQPK